MATLGNTFEGGSDGTTITTGNSGGGSGDTFNGVSNAPTFETTGPIHGSISMLCDGDAADYVVWNNTSMPGSMSEGWFRMYFEVSALPSATAPIMVLRKSGGGVTDQGCDVRITNTGTLQLRDDQEITRFTMGTPISTGVKHRLEVHVISSATVGRIEARLFRGANVDGATPDDTWGDTTTNLDTGDGTIGGIAVGWIQNPGNSADLLVDDIGVSDVAWMGSSDPAEPPTFTSVAHWGVEHYTGGSVAPGYTDILVPSSGAWLGATMAAADAFTSTSTAGVTLWNSMSNIRPPDIIGIYHTGNWSGLFNAAEQAFLDDSGGGGKAIPHVRWKPDDDATQPWMQWADIAAGNMDAELDTTFGNMATHPGKIFFTVWHEMEDNIPGMGTNQEFADMWIHMHGRAATAGADNLIWVPNFVGYRGHAVDHIEPICALLDGYFDWLAWDPYIAETASRDTLAELLNWDPAPQGWANISPGYDGAYDFFTSVYPNTPLMLAEWGIDGGSNGRGVISAAAAVTIIEEFQSSLANFPAIKAYEYWHCDGIGDYQWTDRGGTGVAEFVAFTNDAFFDQDVNAGYD